MIQSKPPLKGIQQHRSSLNKRFILILGTSFCLVIALAIIRQIRGSKQCTKGNFNLKLMNSKSLDLSAFTGGLVASLSYPARSKEINTFSDLINLPKDATIGLPRHTSMDAIIQTSKDPIIQVHCFRKPWKNKFMYICILGCKT